MELKIKEKLKQPHIQVILLFLLSLLIRSLFIPWASELSLVGDEKHYWPSAQILRSSGWDWEELIKANFFAHPPLWPLLLSFFSGASPNPLAGRLLTLLIGSTGPVFIYFVGKYIFNQKTGFVAGLILALYPNHIGYSHYLWPAILFQIQCLLALYFFLLFLEKRGNEKYIVVSFLILSLALLTKEFAIFILFGFIATLIWFRVKIRVRLVLLLTLILIAPSVLYSLYASFSSGRTILLSTGYLVSLHQTTRLKEDEINGLTYRHRFKTLVSHTLRRDVGDVISHGVNQFSRLWSPTSLVAFKLRTKNKNWRYPNTPYPVYSTITVLAYAGIMIFGLLGLCFGAHHPFKIFSIVVLLGLSFFSFVVGHYQTRYRLPFSFILILYTAHALLNIRMNTFIKNRVAAIACLCLLALVGWIFISQKASIGGWG